MTAPPTLFAADAPPPDDTDIAYLPPREGSPPDYPPRPPAGLSYHGGKFPGRAGGRIAAVLPAAARYAEPFAGMAGVLLSRSPAGAEILNDADPEVANWWTVVRDRPDELREAVWSSPLGAEPHRRALAAPIPTDPVDRALRMTVMLSSAFRGRIALPNTARRPASHETTVRKIADCSRRVADVEIRCGDGLEVIEEWADDPDTLIYLDPPYPDTDCTSYAAGVDYGRLLDLIRHRPAMIALSGVPANAAELIGDGWGCLRYDVLSAMGTQRPETLWSNPACQERVGDTVVVVAAGAPDWQPALPFGAAR